MIGTRHRPRIVIYTRERCGLCRRAEAVVARESRGADVHHVDIDADDDLIRRYGLRVPVVVVDEVEVAEVEVARGAVRKAVRVARSQAARGRASFRRGVEGT